MREETNMDRVDRLLPAKVARELIGIGNTKFYELLGTGKIRAVKLGARTLIPESEIERFRRELPSARFSPRTKASA
jgi:excisionase family DNA binding protein